MPDHPLHQLGSLGQSVWLDFLSRHMLESGELAHLLEADAVVGVTSNPAIFKKAIVDTHDYDATIREMAAAGNEPAAIYEALVVEDVRRAADLLRPCYDKTGARDGLVSLEVSPHLARDAAATVTEARRLWREVGRPNLMIKVPGTREGLPAIRQLISEGINVNVTLLFGLHRYRAVAEVFLTALEERLERGQEIGTIASVASFFVSRIDVFIDARLEKMVAEGGPRAELARQLRGQAALACAKIAREIFEEIFTGQQFQRLADKGARPQRLLWASTSTKNPNAADTMYVEPLIGPDTVTTLPLETLHAYRDHGRPALRLGEGRPEAHQTLRHLAEVGIDLDQVARELEEEGIVKFVAPFDEILQAIHRKLELQRVP
jgi:transaldolase